MNKYPNDFRNWYHRNKGDYVLPGEPDPDLAPIYQDWQDLGEPKVKFSPLTPSDGTAETTKQVAKVGIAVTAVYVLYLGVKWGVAALLAPETGGASLVLAGATP